MRQGWLQQLSHIHTFAHLICHAMIEAGHIATCLKKSQTRTLQQAPSEGGCIFASSGLNSVCAGHWKRRPGREIGLMSSQVARCFGREGGVRGGVGVGWHRCHIRDTNCKHLTKQHSLSF